MNVKLVSLKMSKADVEKQYEAKPAAEDAPRYPYGMSLHLDEDTLSKLGIDKLPDVDSPLMLVAKVAVSSVNSNASTGGEKRRSVSLQVTDLGLGDCEPDKKTQDILYDGNKA